MNIFEVHRCREGIKYFFCVALNFEMVFQAMEEVAKLNAELQAKEMELQQESVERQSSSEQLQVEVETKQKTLDDLKKEINIVKHLLEDQQEKTRVAEKARDEVNKSDTLT